MKISIIIPALNEEKTLARTLALLRQLEGDFEIIVVDGGSVDSTVEVANRCGVTTLVTQRGRGAQMNCGAQKANGDILAFLHADTLLPQNSYKLIINACTTDIVVGGCFRLQFDDNKFSLQCCSYVTRFRFSFFHYGDSCFFVRRNVFERIGGFREFPVMEDIDLWLRLRKEGTLVVLNEAVVTSARRFRKVGVIRQQCLSAFLLGLFLLGVSPHTLNRFYRNVR